jgi:hypothetical protein
MNFKGIGWKYIRTLVCNFRTYFTFMWPCTAKNFLVIKLTRCTNFVNLFLNENLHVSDSSSVHHQELFTVHLAMVYVIQVCRQLSSRIILILVLESCLQPCMTYTIAECTVNNCWWCTEELSETCRVSFQNKFEKLVHLVGFIIRKLEPTFEALPSYYIQNSYTCM